VLRRDQLAPIHGWARAGLEARRRRVELVAYGTIGLYGYYGGPRMHIVDYYGLGDPLIARLPIYDREHWQVGHYARSIPNGYIESLRTGQNSIEDAAVRELYRVATVLTRDPIWSLSRFTEIVKANLGLYNPLIRSVNGTAIGPPPVDAGAHGGEPIVLGRRAPPGERYEYGSVVSFAVNGDADQYKRTGWSFPEVRGTWTDGPLASLAIPVPASNRPLKLQMRLAGIRDLPALPFQPVDVFVNGEMIGSWQVADRHFFSAPIPARFVEAPGELWIDLYLPKAVSPAELGHNTDARQLGVQCSELSISEVRR
jgi:hypothetical protein